jgi:hypothetical protein
MPEILRAFERDALYTSDISTGRLMALALTVETVETYSELHGRDRAWYAIANTQAVAIEYVLGQADDDDALRIMASRALALAGWSLAGVLAL